MGSDIGLILNLACIKATGQSLPSSFFLTQDWHYKKIGDKKEAIYRPLSDPLAPIMPSDDPEQSILRHNLIGDLKTIMTLHNKRWNIKLFFSLYHLTILAVGWWSCFSEISDDFCATMLGRDDEFWHRGRMVCQDNLIKQKACEAILRLSRKGYNCIQFVINQFKVRIAYGFRKEEIREHFRNLHSVDFRLLEQTYTSAYRTSSTAPFGDHFFANDWFNALSRGNYRYSLDSDRGVSKIGLALLNMGFTKRDLPKKIDAMLMIGKKAYELNSKFFCPNRDSNSNRYWNAGGRFYHNILLQKMKDNHIREIFDNSSKQNGGIPKTQKGIIAYWKMRMICIGSSLPRRDDLGDFGRFARMRIRGARPYDLLLKEVDTNYWRCAMPNDVLINALAPDHKKKQKILNDKVLHALGL